MILRGHDLWILTAGVTFYALLAMIPCLIVSIRITTALAGRRRVEFLAAAVGRALPQAQSPGPVLQAFIAHASATSWSAVVLALVPATMWGEGLRRGFGRITPAPRGAASSPPPGRWESWRNRLALLPLLLLSPLGLLAVMSIAPELDRLLKGTRTTAERTGGHGLASSLLAFYIALNVDWIVLSAVLAYTYLALGARPFGWRPVLTASLLVGAFMAGFAQGFVVFLAVPVNLASPFAGLTAVGAAVALSLWLWLFTALTVLGYAIALALQKGQPAASATLNPVEPTG